MRGSLIFIIIALIGVGLTACSSQDSQTYVVTDSSSNHITIHDGSIAVHAPDRKDAIITEAGKLSIAGSDVKVTAPQRELLVRYYASAVKFRDQSMSLGGVANASSLLVSAAAGMVSGDSQRIESAVHARSAKITSTASEMCNDLATLASTQDALAAQLAAFRPYAQIKATEAADCRRWLEDFEKAKAQPRS